MGNGKPQLHQSALGMLWWCAYAYFLRYCEGLKVPPGIALITGSGTHVATELNMKRKLDTGELAPLDEVTQSARDYVSGQFDAGDFLLSTQERQDKAVQAWRDDTVDMAVDLSALHYNKVAPTITPTHVERHWVVEVPGLSHDLAGQIDLQQGVESIDDLKTAAQTPSQADVDTGKYAMQISMYGLAQKVIDAVPVDHFNLVGLVKLKREKKVKLLVTRRTNEHYQALLDAIAISVRQIESGLFPPNGLGTWHCSEKFCGFHTEACKYARGHKCFLMGKENGDGD